MQKEEEQKVEDYCKSLIKAFKEKADHNKLESMTCFQVSMGGALLAPLFVTLGSNMAEGLHMSDCLFSKLIPTVLSIAVAFSTAWLQLRKPQQLWALYRTSQRELENCLSNFNFRVGEYASTKDAEKLLAEQTSKIALNAHYAWLPMVPNPENMNANPTSTKTPA